METSDAGGSPATPGAPIEAHTVAAVVADTVSGIVDTMAQVDATIAGLMGVRAELAGQAALCGGMTGGTAALVQPGSARELGERSLRAEVACALRIPEGTADQLLRVGVTLKRDLPGTLMALKAGEISYRHATILVDNLDGLAAETRTRLEDSALSFARRLTAAKFERKVRALRELADPESIRRRTMRAVADREVVFTPARDGMAWLSAYLPAADALASYNRLTELSRALQSPDEKRNLRQLRTDVFRDLLLDGEPSLSGLRGIRPQVFVTVPVLTLLGCSELPATLDGYGPIDPQTARELAAAATSFIRILTHPETGAVLSVGKDSYRVPADLKNWLRVRDSTCRFPGCSRPAVYSDIDHTVDWTWGGETSYDNLAHFCRKHHTLKHESGWRVANSKDGVLKWRSPQGRTYITDPEIRMRP